MPTNELEEAEANYDKIIDTLLLNLHAPNEEWLQFLPGLPAATRRYRAALNAAAQGELGEAPLLSLVQRSNGLVNDTAEASQLFSIEADSLEHDTAALFTVLSRHRNRL
jgi:hypothetical protein